MLLLTTFFILLLGITCLALALRLWVEALRRKRSGGLPVPFLASSIVPWELLTVRLTLGEYHRQIYRQFPDASAIGFYTFLKPCLLLRDLELIKRVMVTDFCRFKNNDFIVDKTLDPLMHLNPFTVQTKEWKELRGIQLPMQTPKKVQAMYPDILRAAINLQEFVKSHSDKEVEAKRLISKYTGDSVAACAFGLQSNSFQNTEDFGDAAKGEVFAASYLDNLAVLSALIGPVIAKLLRLRVIRKDLSDFFIETVRKARQHRLEKRLRRSDFLQYLIDKGSTVEGNTFFNDTELAAHCMTFYMDGTETTGLAIAWSLWELGRNQGVQEKLRREIKAHGSRLEDFEDLTKLVYLEAVISETLRLHPPIQSITRLCTQDTELLLDGGKRKLEVKTGTPVVIPLLALHTDPSHFPEPEIFRPERFITPSSQEEIPKYAYLPYGDGPRICVGMKFASLQMKTALLAVLLDHRVVSSREEASLDPYSTFLHTPKGGLPIKFIPTTS